MFVNFVKKFVKIKNVVDEKIVYIDILYNKFLEVSLFFLIGVFFNWYFFLFYCCILFIYSIIFLYSVNLIYVVNYLIYFVFEILWII